MRLLVALARIVPLLIIGEKFQFQRLQLDTWTIIPHFSPPPVDGVPEFRVAVGWSERRK
jgi:hypothetical protein